MAAGAIVIAAEVTCPIIYGSRDLEADMAEIDFDGLKSIIKTFIDNELKSINFKDIIGLPGLIQSQHERRSASSAFLQVNTYRRGFPSFEKLL